MTKRNHLIHPIWVVAGAIAFVLVLAAPSIASAATTRYAMPGGVITGSCDLANPCNLATAIMVAPDPNTEVLLLSGDYGSAATPITLDFASDNVTKLAPMPGATRPHIYLGGTSGQLDLAEGASIADVDIIHSATGPDPAVTIFKGSLVRSSVHSATGTACRLIGTGYVVSSVCATSAPYVPAIALRGDVNGAAFTIDHLTAWSSGASGTGLDVLSEGGGYLQAAVTSSILHGPFKDISVSTSLGAGTAALNVVYSNYSRVVAVGSGASIASYMPQSNQTAEPLLTNPAAFDFTETLASPTIDAGAFGVPGGPADIIGKSRQQGLTTDIGAFEATPVPSKVTALALTPTKFRAEADGAAISAAKSKKSKAPRGSTVAITVDQVTRVKFVIEKAKPGRKVGGSCKEPSRSNKKRKSCTRYSGVPGFLWKRLPAGPSTLHLSGRGKSKALAPGKYRLKATPVTSPLPKGVPAYANFTILP